MSDFVGNAKLPVFVLGSHSPFEDKAVSWPQRLPAGLQQEVANNVNWGLQRWYLVLGWQQNVDLWAISLHHLLSVASTR